MDVGGLERRGEVRWIGLALSGMNGLKPEGSSREREREWKARAAALKVERRTGTGGRVSGGKGGRDVEEGASGEWVMVISDPETA